MTARLRQVALLGSLALAMAAPLSNEAHAAGKIPAGLELVHSAPVNGHVSAQMIGKSFWPKERVHVTYVVTVRGVSTQRYQFDTTSDRFGAFYRTLRFTLGKPTYGYSLIATATGERGDHARLSTWASGQGHEV